ncbi:hypothetical protein D5086_023607 [Populus alba]|uniref:Uncharacterized protein n=1 Tax=Populus alba TaxID=43335 RepID=A0ACC4BAV2_POPAL
MLFCYLLGGEFSFSECRRQGVLEGVDPSLEFVLTSRDITATGAPATLLIFNNEKAFSAKNTESICSVGNSTKKGNRKRG